MTAAEKQRKKDRRVAFSKKRHRMRYRGYGAGGGNLLVRCPECRGKISQFAVTCPHCGLPYKEIPHPPQSRWRRLRRGLLALILAGLFSLVAVLLFRALRPALPQLSEQEKMLVEALAIGLEEFEYPEHVVVEQVGELKLSNHPSVQNPDGIYSVTLRLRYTDEQGQTLAATYALALADYEYRPIFGTSRYYQRGTLEQISTLFLVQNRDMDVKLLNRALAESIPKS
jgi:hypothetical protein